MLHVTAWHDNTSANKNNPDPTQWVGTGSRSIDEMLHLWVNITYLTEQDYQRTIAERKKAAAAAPANSSNENGSVRPAGARS